MGTQLGDELRAARSKQAWSLREVETRSGIHNAHLSQIETGVIEQPAPNVLWTLAAIYNLDFTKLMRLAGHVDVSPPATKTRGSLVGAALRSIGTLTPKQQRDVLDYIREVGKSGGDKRTRSSG